MKTDDPEFLHAALIGYQQQLVTVQAKIDEMKRRLGGEAAPRKAAATAARTKKHRISAAGRARIAAAQRKRWAAARKAK